MTLPPISPLDRRRARADRWMIAVSGLVLVLAVAVAVIDEATPGWARYQAEARGLAAPHGIEVAEGIQQIWIPEISRVDRCVTCHVTIEAGPELADAPNPVRSHPRPELLVAHPVERFGCTLCHGGQGAATSLADAHGDVPFWDEPLLDGRRARTYGLTASDLLEMRCNVCHRRDTKVEGMPLLDAAKAEVAKRRCVRCHVLDGEGGTRGPDLTYEGDKHPTRYDLPESLVGTRSALRWHVEHFLDPKRMSPGTEMPKFTLTDRQAAGLALLVLSWRRPRLPASWLPSPTCTPAGGP